PEKTGDADRPRMGRLYSRRRCILALQSPAIFEREPMKAMVVTRHGGPEVLELQSIPDPVPGDNDLLIEVHASALNPVDVKIRSDGRGQSRTFPFILGFDVSGVVAAVG